MTKDAAEIEYDKSQMLHPGLTYPPGDASCFTGAPIELHLLPATLEDEEETNGDEDGDDAPAVKPDAEPELDRAQLEAVLIARRINELVGRDGGKPMCVMEKSSTGALRPRPIQYKDIVVLLRSMRYKGEDYAQVLRSSGIPVHSESGTGYFDSMEVNDILSLLHLLDNRAQDIPLAAVLRSPIASLPEPEDSLARIRLAYPDRSIPFHQAVGKYAAEQDDELAAKLKDVLGQLDRWRTMAQRRPLAELIWEVYDSTGYLAFCSGLRDGEQRKANLIDLHDRARQFGSFQRQGLARFLAFIDQLREESDLGQPPVVSEGENVVRIMTIHHSKGLEFPVVIVPDLGKRFNLSDCSGSILVDRHAYLGMAVVDETRQVRYPSLASTLVATRLRRQSMAEELRVLYVAMTRAREHLICIGTCKTDLEEEWRARWSAHKGPLPADEVSGAGCMLDWLGPAATAMKAGKEELIRIIRHSVKEVVAWQPPESLRPTEGERQRRLAELTPLDPDPPADPVAKEIIARLTSPYGFTPFTKIPAAAAATMVAKPQSAMCGASGQAEATKLDLPRAVQSDFAPTAADIGSATHLVLQHVDFTRRCDISDLRSQISDLVEKRLIAPSAANSIDTESICWLVGSRVGELLRKHASTLRRELPLYLAMGPDEFDPSARSDDRRDRVMLRSRLDVLVPTPAGLEIVDYKTDRVARPDLYKPQMRLYRRAVEAMTGKRLAAVHLVFLSARRIESLSPIE
jgi:ATP-dependent helicase/nuclease subunit A